MIIGTRKDIKEKIGVDYAFPKPYKKQLVLKDILKNVPNSPCAVYSDKKKEVLKYVKPGDWIFEGSIAEQYKQIGNVVPVNMAKEVGLSIKHYLERYYK